jgi:hypothetical protein
MTDDNRDPFALGGRQDDADRDVLRLFRQWIAAASEYDRELATPAEDDEHPAGELMGVLEEAILNIAGGPVALAIKTLIAVRIDHAAWTPETAMLRIDRAFDDDERDFVIELAISRIRDAAGLVPEIAALAAPVIHADAALIDAEIAIGWCRDQLAAPVHLASARVLGWEHGAKRHREIEADLAALLDRVAKTEAKTARGRAIKAAIVAEARP